MSRNSLPAQRDRSVDMLKGTAVLAMLVTHMLSFFPILPATALSLRLTEYYLVFSCLFIFSSFMFSLGHSSWSAYISRDMGRSRLGRKLLSSIGKLMLPYYISTIAYVGLITRELSLRSLVDILLIRHVGGYAEFLLCFALVYLGIFLLAPLLKKLDGRALLLLLTLSLAATFIPYERINRVLPGLFIGSAAFTCYPIIQYQGYFLLGLYAAKRGIGFDRRILAASLCGFAFFIAVKIVTHAFPSRFPPGFGWIAGGFFLVYGVWLILKALPDCRLTSFLALMGRNTIDYLLVSNLVLFSLRRLCFELGKDPSGVLLLLFYLGVLALCILLPMGYYRLVKSKKSGKAA